MKRLQYVADVKTLLRWSLATGWRASKRLFLLLNIHDFLNGSYGELMKLEGLYHEMFTKQAEGYR